MPKSSRVSLDPLLVLQSGYLGFGGNSVLPSVKPIRPIAHDRPIFAVWPVGFEATAAPWAQDWTHCRSGLTADGLNVDPFGDAR
jgi:hypothetical protein